MILVPQYYAKDIFSIPTSFFVDNGIKVVLSDLDNTLDVHYELNPSKRVYELKKRLNNAGIKLFIVSNNREKRKGIYPKRLGVEGIFSCRKPLPKKILNFLKEKSIKIEEFILIGDQLVTDVLCSKLGKFRCVLTEPISKCDQWTTKFNRLIDRPLRAIMRKKGYLEKVRVG